MLMQNVKYDDVLTFGKYKGQTLRNVIDTNPQYISWAIENKVISLNLNSNYYLLQALEQRNKHRRFGYTDDEDAEMDFAMGLSGGGQGW